MHRAAAVLSRILRLTVIPAVGVVLISNCGREPTVPIALSGGEAASVKAAPGPQSWLIVTTAAGGAVAGAALTTPPVVEFRSPQGVLQKRGADIAVAIEGSAHLSGPTTVTAVDGVATFGGLSIDAPGTYTLVFTAGGARPATAVVVVVAPVTTLQVSLAGAGSVESSPAGIDCGVSCAATFALGTSVTLTPTADAAWVFAGWTGACTGAGACVMTMDAAKTVTATFVKRTFMLSLAKAGTGGGSVVSGPAGIDCGTTCGASFDVGTTVTLTATADANAKFDGWSGACSGGVTCVVTMSAAQSVTATFTKHTYGLGVTRVGTGGGSVVSSPAGIDCGATCNVVLDAGMVVTLTATPDATSSFTGWSGACSGTGPCVITLDLSKSVTATFTRHTFAVSVARAGSGAGSVKSSPAGIDCGVTCSAMYDEGVSVTLTASPDATSSFAGWTGACSGTGACVVPIAAATSLTATFVRNTFALTIARTGDGAGTVTSSPAGIDCGSTCVATYDQFTVVTLTATAEVGSTFLGWSGSPCGSAATCVVTMNAAHTVTAAFAKQLFLMSVTLTGAGKGKVVSSPAGIDCGFSCTVLFDARATVTLTATPDAASTFAGWGGACTGTGSCEVTMTAAMSVTASFVRNAVTLSIVVTGNTGATGRLTSLDPPIDCAATCDVIVSQGTAVTLTATPGPNSKVGAWGGACAVLPNGARECFMPISGPMSVSMTFEPIPLVTLTVTKSGTGSGSVGGPGIACGALCSTSVAQGSSATLGATATLGSTFDGWTGSCVGTGLCNLTMDAPKTVGAVFNLIGFPVSVAFAGTGAGRVTSSPAGIDCDADCAATFVTGHTVTLTAAAAAGSTFVGWSGACSGTGTCSIASLSAAATVTATFTKGVQVSVARAGNGGGRVTSSPAGIDCGALCAALLSGPVTLTVTPDATSSFAGWTGACVGTGDCVLDVNATPLAATATFTRNSYVLTVNRTPGGNVVSGDGGINCGAICSAPYLGLTVVSLNAKPDPGFAFIAWTGACSGTGPCNVTMVKATSVNATFALTVQRLTVSKTGGGSGIVNSTPSGIDCGPTCVGGFDMTAPVTLTAAPDPGSTFGGWSGDCSGTGACVLTMNFDHSVTATFLTSTTLTVARAGTGAGRVVSTPPGIDCGSTCVTSYAQGSGVTLTATPDVASQFAGWSGGGCSGTGTCTVTLNASVTVTATFTRLAGFTLTTAKTGSGDGVLTTTPLGINCGVTCSTVFPFGTTVTVRAVADLTSTFGGWVEPFCAGPPNCTFPLTGSTTVTARFIRNSYNVSVTLAGTGGGTVVSAPAGIDCGTTCFWSFLGATSVTLHATPNGASSFTGWSGACSGTSPDCTFTVNGFTSATANFAALGSSLTVTRAGDGGGAVLSSPSGINCGVTCASAFPTGTIVTLTATPDATSTFGGWSGSCFGVATCPVTIDAAKSVMATFVRQTAMLSLTFAGAGTGSVSISPPNAQCTSACAVPIALGTTVTLSYKEDAGSTFAGWGGACSGTGPCTLTIDAPKSVTATFVSPESQTSRLSSVQLGPDRTMRR